MLGSASKRKANLAWTSYAQNAEDVRLRRAFAGQATGFYIDVGANHPVTFSLTKHFYDSGWSGINVEPLPAQYERIRAARPRDTTLNVGCSSQAGTLTLYEALGGVSGMSTFTLEEVAEHRQKGFEFREVSCPVLTLASICEEHAAGRTIDFMSVDVEGHEASVLAGADFERFRPRVIVVEATRPNSTEPTHERWESLIVNHGYLFAVFDGLNRYYVRREDEALVPALSLPPNVFDDYVPFIYQRRIELLESRLAEASLLGRLKKPVVSVKRAAHKLRRWVEARRSGGGA